MPFEMIRGRAVRFGRANVDTDLIIPAQYMKTVGRHELGKGAFAALRQEPNNIFDDPRNAGAAILIAGRNFGCGSSREHAVWALQDLGFEAVIAPSFGEIFENNALRNGLLAVRLTDGEVAALMASAGEGAIEIDLRREEVTAAGLRFQFSLDPFRKHCLMNELDEISVTLELEHRIAAFEQRQAKERAWMSSVLQRGKVPAGVAAPDPPPPEAEGKS